MSATSSEATTGPYPRRAGFDESMAGRRAECDGGMPVASGGGSREEFTARGRESTSTTATRPGAGIE
jgi:hypothetical protein